MERKARWVCLISAVIIGIFAAVFALSEREKAFSVRTAQAKTQDIYNSVTVFGSVVPSRTVSLVPENSSVVTEVFVREGDTVEKGQPLCTLKAAETPPLSAADVQAAVSAVQADPDETETVAGNAVASPFPGTVLSVPRAGQTVRRRLSLCGHRRSFLAARPRRNA